MNRITRYRCGLAWLIVGSVLVLSVLPGAPHARAQDPPAKDGSTESLPAFESSQWLADQAALYREIVRLRRAGKWDEVEALTIKMVARPREIMGEFAEETIVALGRLASLYKERENWPAARKILEEIRSLRERQPDRKDWKVGDARRAVADLDLRTAMTPAQRARWDEGKQLASRAQINSLRQDHKAAVKNGQEAERILRDLLGEDRADYLLALRILAHCYIDKGDHAQAVPALRKEVDILGKAWGESHPSYANELLSLAEAYDKMGDPARAEPLYRQALASFTKAYDYADRRCLDILLKLGSRYVDNDDYAHAEPLLRQLQAVLAPIDKSQRYLTLRPGAELAEKLARQVYGKDRPGYADSLSFLANLRVALGDFGRAEPLYRQAMEIRKKALGEGHRDCAQSLNDLAALYWAKGDYGRAEPLYLQALEIRKKALGENHPLYATSLNDLARLRRDKGDHARAEPLFRQALAILKKAPGEDRLTYATVLSNLAELYLSEGAYSRAEPLSLQVLEIRKKALGESHPDYYRGLNNLAGLYRARGDYARAEPLLRRALGIKADALSEGHAQDYCSTLVGLASLYHDMGDDARAEPLYREALQILKKAPGEGHPDYAACLNNLANLHWAKGNFARAEPLYRQALEIRKKALGEAHPDCAESLNNLASLYWAKGDRARAEPLFRQALEIVKKALGEGHRVYGQSLNNLAVLYLAGGDYARAKPLFLQVLEIHKKALGESHPDYFRGLNNLAALYVAKGDDARAGQLLSESLANGDRFLRTTLAVLGDRQRLRLLAAQRAALDLLITVTPADGPGTADLYRRALDWKGAADALQAEDRLVRDQPELRRLLVELADVRASLARYAFVVPNEPSRVAWRAELDRLRVAKEIKEANLARRSAEYRRRQRDREQGPEELAAALPGEAALVDLFEYTHSSPPAAGKGPSRRERRLIAFVVRRGRPAVLVPLGPARPIDDAVLAWRQATVAGRAGARDAAAAELGRRVWERLRPHLGGARTVLVAPDGQLSAFPFAALPGRAPGSYLIEDLAIGYVASGRQAAAAFADPPGLSGRGLLAAGDVDFQADPSGSAPSGRPAPLLAQRSAFAPLPASGHEARAALDLFHTAFAGQPAELLSGAGATEAEVKRRLDGGHLRVVHLAIHGFFESPARIFALRAEVGREGTSAPSAGAGKDDVNSNFDLTPMLRSGVVLAGGGRAPGDWTSDNGILTAEEVQGLDLRGCELVVLSACDTGLGDIEAGQGVLGLQRAFQTAGARAVVASLWKVEDAATAVVMERFYTNLWTKKLPKLEALRRAQLDVLKDPSLVDARRVQMVSRGIASAAERLPGGARADQPKAGFARRGDPALWAAFLLSGDGRSFAGDSQ
jgi:CHAT domain-containing protein/Tfp pilus assembly protein PilF